MSSLQNRTGEHIGSPLQFLGGLGDLTVQSLKPLPNALGKGWGGDNVSFSKPFSKTKYFFWRYAAISYSNRTLEILTKREACQKVCTRSKHRISEQTPNICALFKCSSFGYNLGYCLQLGIYQGFLTLFYPQKTIKQHKTVSTIRKRNACDDY
jgi:hypothetical protein